MALRQLPDYLQKTAIEELNEVPERIPADIEALKTWIQQQPHLTARTDEQFLIAFLRGCKYSLEKAKSKIDKFYTLRTQVPEMFGVKSFDMNKIIEVLKLGAILYLPIPLNDNGPRIGIMRMGAYSADEYNFIDILHVGQILQEITLLEDDYANVNGIVHIMDLANVTKGHLFQMTPGTMKKMTVWTEQALPLRPKANHFVNTPTGFDVVFNMVKPMLSQKQQDRLHVHGNNMDSLHAQIPKKYLPKEYGGENGSLQDVIDSWVKRFESYRDYYIEEKNYGTDEKLRPGKPIDFEGLLGIDGSFRKLNVD
ncbi:alpha-tocopherol transfer protein-like [Teleopsis dalmanni]|uniref:alpha-tocopherol transfer protein-like n=1 Tax=Teleopsis dalmanni TaxID=139649 RepID=UPI0018CCEBF4|nr:alpha-tocopherol transfer protein-like [Teleopsis dalmanni]